MNTRMIVGILVLGTNIWSACAQPKIEVKNVEAMEYFSSSYKEAREKFLEAAQAVGASIESVKHPDTGPEGEPLFTDIALIGPKDAKRMLVLSSGTHGVEGFTGSGIQTGLLREGIASSLKPRLSIVMIHAINPYGFAHLRRFNEDNVDLNRNFVNHSKPYPDNPGYEELADVLAPESLSFPSEIFSWAGLLWFRMRNGKAELAEAITGGQYTHPEGLFYGGTFEAWSNKTVRSIAHRYLSHADRIVVIDFHTGLGAFGTAEVILNVPEESPAYKRAVAMWGTERVKSTTTGTSVSVHLSATLKLAFPEMLPDAEVTALSLEYGTSPPLEVFKAVRAENWLHHRGGKDHPNSKKIKNELLRVFFPDTDDWKELVWLQGKEVTKLALRGINGSGSSL